VVADTVDTAVDTVAVAAAVEVDVVAASSSRSAAWSTTFSVPANGLAAADAAMVTAADMDVATAPVMDVDVADRAAAAVIPAPCSMTAVADAVDAAAVELAADSR
jgi:hypothetical protein